MDTVSCIVDLCIVSSADGMLVLYLCYLISCYYYTSSIPYIIDVVYALMICDLDLAGSSQANGCKDQEMWYKVVVKSYDVMTLSSLVADGRFYGVFIWH